METVNLTIFIISVAIFIAGAVIGKLEKWPVSEPFLAMVIGIVCGPYALDLLDMNEWGDPDSIMILSTRLTIAMALMATALRLPADYVKKYRKSESILVIGIMLLMWLAGTILFLLFFGFPLELAALAGAIITPSDPVVSSSIISGNFAKSHFKEKIRRTLSFEAGSNDGLAFPLVALPLLLLTESQALQHWALKSLLWETLGGILLGYLLGVLAGRIVNRAHRNKWMTEKSLLAASLTLAFIIIGGFELINLNSIIAVFAGGIGFNSKIDKEEILKDEKVQETLERLFVVPIFFFFGLIIPFQLWIEQGWLLLIFVVAVLLLKRIPAFFLLKRFLKRFNSTDLLVMGWLGPIGISSLFYVFHSLKTFENEILWTVISAVVFASTTVHGITASIVGKWYKSRSN